MLVSIILTRYLGSLYLQPDIVKKKPFGNDLRNWVDLLKIRIQEQPIEEVAESLLRETFNLKLAYGEWFGQGGYRNKEFMIFSCKNQVQKEQLPDTFFSVVQEYESIFERISKKRNNQELGGQDFERPNHDEMIFERPNYDGMILMPLLHPSPKVQYLVNWFNESLKFEIAFILSDLVLNKKVKMTKERIEGELMPFLYNTLIRFGGYSIFTETWQPDDEDRDPLVNSMKILSAKLEMEHK